jgi:hypothetical protein
MVAKGSSVDESLFSAATPQGRQRQQQVQTRGLLRLLVRVHTGDTAQSLTPANVLSQPRQKASKQRHGAGAAATERLPVLVTLTEEELQRMRKEAPILSPEEVHE